MHILDNYAKLADSSHVSVKTSQESNKIGKALTGYYYSFQTFFKIDQTTFLVQESFNQVSPCDSGPCENGGECSNVGNSSFECECSSGFSGKRCQDKGNEGKLHVQYYK